MKSIRLITKISQALQHIAAEHEAAIEEAEYYRRSERPHARMATGRPLPRLEFEHVAEGTWSNRICHYWLVIPLSEHDIRREAGEEQKAIYSEWYVPMGKTVISGGNPDRAPVWEGKPETPFRDGAHATFDRAALNPSLPIWAVCGADAAEVMNKPNVQVQGTEDQTAQAVDPATPLLACLSCRSHSIPSGCVICPYCAERLTADSDSNSDRNGWEAVKTRIDQAERQLLDQGVLFIG